jgi:hypothetical protein
MKRLGKGLQYAAWLAMWAVFCAAWFVHPWWMKLLMIPLGVLTRYIVPYVILGALVVAAVAGRVVVVIVGSVVFVVLGIPYLLFIYVPLHAEETYRRDGYPPKIRPYP